MRKNATPLSIVLLYILALIIMSGCFIVFGGAAAFTLWTVPVVISILYALKDSPHQTAFLPQKSNSFVTILVILHYIFCE